MTGTARTITDLSVDTLRVRIKDLSGQVITATDIKLAIIRGPGKPVDTDWVVATWEGAEATARVATVLVGPGHLELVPGRYRVWYRFTDSPEIPVYPVDGWLEIV